MTTSKDDVDASNYLDESFKSWIEQLMRKHHLPGLSVAVVSQGKIHADGYGYALLPQTKAAGETLYPMCSTTKAFTCAVLGMLIEEAQKSSVDELKSSKTPGLAVLKAKGWSTPISHILRKDFVTTSPVITKYATLEDLASHRTGIPGHDFLWGPCHGPDYGNITRMLRHLEPGVEVDFRGKLQYNNLMYAVLGHVIETVTGQSFDQVLRERLLKSLGMIGTWTSIERAKAAIGSANIDIQRWSRPYCWRDTTEDDSKGGETSIGKSGEQDSDKKESKGIYYPSHWASLLGAEPAGALVSSVADYAKWVVCLLKASKAKPTTDQVDAGVANEQQNSDGPISPALFKTLTSPRSFMPTPLPHTSPLFTPTANIHSTPITYALGWYADPHFIPGELVISHGGGLPGIGTLVTFLPNLDFGLVIAGNSGAANLIVEAVAKELLGRRAGWSEERRRKHDDDEAKKKAEKEEAEKAKAAKEKADLPGPGPAGVADGASQSTGENVTLDGIDFAGKYHHPGYGTFVLSSGGHEAASAAESPSINGADIVRPKTKPSTSTTGKPKSQQPPIAVSPIGNRAVQWLFLLHPGSSSPTPIQSGSHSRTIIPLAMEAMISHGEFSQCALPELDEGWPDPRDATHPGPEEGQRHGLWESTPVKKGGAALELELEDHAAEQGDKQHRERVVKRLALRLARIEDEDDGKEKAELEEGWEDRMVWFTRIKETS